MGEVVSIHSAVYAVLDETLLHHDASDLIAALFRDLPNLPTEARVDRRVDEPDVFICQFVRRAAGLMHTFDFAVNDGWQPGRLHVVGVQHVSGGRAF